MTSVDIDYLRGLPKAELHVHLEGTLDAGLRRALAARNGIELPAESPDEYTFHDLPTFLDSYYAGMNVLLTENDFYDLTSTYLARAASEGVLHAEMFFDPQAHTSRGVEFSTVVTGIGRAIADARSALGIDASLILCFLRDLGAPFAMATLLEALPYADQILGVGLDSDEKGHPPVEYAAVFARARAEGFKLTMHCDVDQQNTVEHIRQVIEEIGVDRIDHGSNIIESPELMEKVREIGLGLTCCPISNGRVSSSTKSREILQLLRAGLCVTINSDDPPYFGGWILDNWVALVTEADPTPEEIVRFAENSFTASWLEPAERAAYLARVQAYVTSHPAAPVAD